MCDIMGNFHHRYWLGAAQVSYHFPGHQAPNLPLLTHSSYPVLNPSTVATPFRLAGRRVPHVDHPLAEEVPPDFQPVIHSPDVVDRCHPPGPWALTVSHQAKEQPRVHLVLPSHDPIGVVFVTISFSS